MACLRFAVAAGASSNHPPLWRHTGDRAATSCDRMCRRPAPADKWGLTSICHLAETRFASADPQMQTWPARNAGRAGGIFWAIDFQLSPSGSSGRADLADLFGGSCLHFAPREIPLEFRRRRHIARLSEPKRARAANNKVNTCNQSDV